MMFYDRDGEPISSSRANELLSDPTYRRVEETTVRGESVELWVSTVWLGVDHGFGMSDRPIIFETMVFDSNGGVADMAGLEQVRYATEAGALEGHRAIVADLRSALDLSTLNRLLEGESPG